MKLSNSQYNRILNEYSEQRFENIRDLDMRTEKLYKEIPRLKEIQDTISSLSVSSARKMLRPGKNISPDDISKQAELLKLKTTIASLAAERASLLKKHGYPEDLLTLSHKCNDCKDTGYVGDGQCKCFKNKVVKLLYQQSNIEDVLQRENFGSFSPKLYDNVHKDEILGCTPYENIINTLNIIKDYVKNFDTSYKNLYIYGESGVGKTFLSNCIAKELIDLSHSVIYLSASRLFDLLADDTFNRADDSSDAFKLTSYLYDCDLLIIDDLGTELINTFTTSELFTCINERNLNRKSTIISSNLSLMELGKFYSERIFSRLTTYTMIKIIGEDLRIKISLSS